MVPFVVILSVALVPETPACNVAYGPPLTVARLMLYPVAPETAAHANETELLPAVAVSEAGAASGCTDVCAEATLSPAAFDAVTV